MKTQFETHIYTDSDMEIPVIVSIEASFARRPISEDDGDEIEILSVRASEDVLENGKFVFHAGDDVELTDKLTDKILGEFYEHMQAEHENRLADRYDVENER